MDKRYQIFVSSTFVDLKDERQAVLRAVLELDQMPAGMELFPAADASAWQLIKDVIDSSDYYVLVMGGRYGSLDETGLGYTEREYDYAVQRKKPVIALLHENPDNLPREKTETDEVGWNKLKAFRAKVEKHHTCSHWKSAEELKARVIVALTAATKRTPAIGWVRADQVPSEATVTEILALRSRVSELEKQLTAGLTSPPAGTEDLRQGDDLFELHYSFDSRSPRGVSQSWTATMKRSWNDIFGAVAPAMINEASEDDLEEAFTEYFTETARAEYAKDKDLKGHRLSSFEFRDSEIETCIIQLRALGLIRGSQKPRSVRDTRAYWALTKYGDLQMTQLRALRRKPLAPAAKGSATPTSGQ